MALLDLDFDVFGEDEHVGAIPALETSLGFLYNGRRHALAAASYLGVGAAGDANHYT